MTAVKDHFEDFGKPISTGVPGLDDISRGGFPAGCLQLITGTPGAGKTTLAMQFLLEGVRTGETSLYITLSETRREITAVARSHQWDISKLQISELVPSETNLSPAAQLTVFNPSELELGETTQAMIQEIEKYQPKRIVLDSLSELRLVAQSALRFRRQILALKQFFAGRDCTVLLLDDASGSERGEIMDSQLESIAHGVIQLEHLPNQYGAERRRLRIVKLRGVAFRGGYHDFVIRQGGLDVYPRLIAAEHQTDFSEELLPTDHPGLDGLLRGGLPLGTSTLLIGPAGTGKSSVATQIALGAAARGMRSAMFVFDENLSTLGSRSRKLGMNIKQFMDEKLITVQQIDPAELSPGEFAARIRDAVDGKDSASQPARVVIIDSLNGYLNAMPEEKFLIVQMHELLAYLGQQGVITVMTVTQSGMIGSAMIAPVDTTYLADNVILFRYFEDRGQVRRAISVAKKRNSAHEFTIRELNLGERGIEIGKPLSGFHGVLTGVPTYVGGAHELATDQTDE